MFHSQDPSSCRHWSLIFQIQELRPKSAGSGDPGNGARAPWSLGASLICDHHCLCLAPDSGLWMLSCGRTAWTAPAPRPLISAGFGVSAGLRPRGPYLYFGPVCQCSWPLPWLLGACSLPLPQVSVLDVPPPLRVVRDPRLAASEIRRPAGVSSHPGCQAPPDSGSLCVGLSSLPHPT